MELYPIDESLQELSELARVSADDLFIVSEVSSYIDRRGIQREQYQSKKLKYSTLSAGLYLQFDICSLTGELADVQRGVTVLSGDVSMLSSDLYGLSVAFLSNDALTRLIPAISAKVDVIYGQLSDIQPIDKLVDLGTGEGFGAMSKFQLSNYSINKCSAMAPLARFNVPDQDWNGRPEASAQLSNITRHLMIDLSSAVDMYPKFSNNCKYISDFDLTSQISAGEHVIFSMKEIERDVMYVTRRNVLCVGSGTDEGEILVALTYFLHNQDKMVTDVFPALCGTYISSDYLSDHYLTSADIDQPGKYFSHWHDFAYPTKKLRMRDYQGYYISADMVLCAIYSDRAPIQVYFYGDVYDTATSSYGPLVKDASPQYYGTNMSADVPQTIIPGTHIKAGSMLLAWGENSLSGPLRLPSVPEHWYLSAGWLSSGFAELCMYALTKPEHEYTRELSVNDGEIEWILSDETVLELDYDFNLDTDWDIDQTTGMKPYEYYGTEPSGSDIKAVILRLDRLEGDDDVQKVYGYLVSADFFGTDTYVYTPPAADANLNEESQDGN